MTALPEVPAGTVLRLAPGEWCTEQDRAPVWSRTDVRVGHIQPDTTEGATTAWVTGHAIECEYPSSTCTTPCMTLRVQVAAIRRQVP